MYVEKLVRQRSPEEGNETWNGYATVAVTVTRRVEIQCSITLTHLQIDQQPVAPPAVLVAHV